MSDYTYSLPFSNERFMKGIIMMAAGEKAMPWQLILLFL